MEEQQTTIKISPSTIIQVLIILFMVWFMFAIKDISMLLLVSVVISSAMDPLADYLHKKRIPRALSVLTVYLLFIGLISVMVYLLIPPTAQQFKDLSQSDMVESINSRLGTYKASLDHFGFGEALQNNIKDWASTISQTLFKTTRGLVTGLVSTLTVLVISFYLSAEENGMKNFVKQLTPATNRERVMGVVNKIQKKIGFWVLGQLILSFVIFGLTFIGLSIIGVEYALVLALIAGILEVVPYIGPIISAIPAVFFAFLQAPALALAVIILYLVVQQLENHIIVPVVMSKSVGLSPVIIILGLLVGGSLGGVLGAILATPILGGISIVVEELWSKKSE